LAETNFDGPVIMHGFEESDVPATVAFMRQYLRAE
jgi:hypothetical protein